MLVSGALSSAIMALWCFVLLALVGTIVLALLGLFIGWWTGGVSHAFDAALGVGLITLHLSALCIAADLLAGIVLVLAAKGTRKVWRPNCAAESRNDESIARE